MKMFSNVRFANVTAMLALIVALGGTSYAAIKLPKNSVGSRQIKSNAVRSGEVKNGSLLGKDFKTGQLPAGAKGDKGDKGDKGNAGQSITAGTSLPSGQTLDGVFAGAGGNGQYINLQINFVPHIPASLDSSHTVRVTGTSATHCPGQGQAEAGYFCLYEVVASGVGFGNFGNPSTAGTGADRRGANVFYTSSTALGYVYGTWAYKAP